MLSSINVLDAFDAKQQTTLDELPATVRLQLSEKSLDARHLPQHRPPDFFVVKPHLYGRASWQRRQAKPIWNVNGAGSLYA